MIKNPIITEKTLVDYKNLKKVTFEVAINTTKDLARKELEELYGVKVQGVWVNNRLGKVKTNRLNRRLIKNPDRKVMVFKLSEKDEIDIFKS